MGLLLFQPDLGLGVFVAFVLLLAAGLGAFGKFFRVLLALVLTLVGCGVVFVVIADHLEPAALKQGGDFAGMFVVQALFGAAVAALPLIIVFTKVAFSLPASLHSGRRSPVLLCLAGLLFALVVAQCVIPPPPRGRPAARQGSKTKASSACALEARYVDRSAEL